MTQPMIASPPPLVSVQSADDVRLAATHNPRVRKGMALVKCFACGVEKDTEVLEPFPYPDCFVDEPLAPLWILDVQSNDWPPREWRTTVVCHECFHKIDPDMWIREDHWNNINPVVPFDRLPLEDKQARNQRRTIADYGSL
jgi:hypothetical protein